MTPMSMTRYTSTAVLLLGLWTLPSSGEVSQNSSDGTCSVPTSQNGALALIPTFENYTVYLTVNELNDLRLAVKELKDLSLAVKELKDLRLAVKELKDLRLAVKELKDLIAAANNAIDYSHQATDRMYLMIFIFLSVVGLLGPNFFKTVIVIERAVQPSQLTYNNNGRGTQNIYNGTGHTHLDNCKIVYIHSYSPDQSMPGTSEVPTNRSESADPAGLTIAVPDGVPVGVPVEVPVNMHLQLTPTDNTAGLVTMETKSPKPDGRKDEETLVPIASSALH